LSAAFFVKPETLALIRNDEGSPLCSGNEKVSKLGFEVFNDGVRECKDENEEAWCNETLPWRFLSAGLGETSD
jgi:hypothetical protein